MVQDPKHELLDLAAVHHFYIQVLEKHLGHSIPVPAEAGAPEMVAAKLENSILQMKRWLDLLDMAVSAPMVRDALKDPANHSQAEPLYRYYVLKPSHTDPDRDKSDFLGAHLLRNPGLTAKCSVAAITGSSSSKSAYSYLFSQQQAQEFEKEISSILRAPAAALPPEHEQLLREFQYLHQEADEFRTFDELMDSGILQRVREMKSQFGVSFYHPRVLAASAVYNVFFGMRFDELFREAAAQIKAFAAKVQLEGGSIMSRVDGDVTVKNLAEVEESKILKQEYGRAKESFQKISKFKKAVDSRRSGRLPSKSAAAGPPTSPRAAAAAAAAKMARPAGVQALAEGPGRMSYTANATEDAKVKSIVESIRNFVRAADAASANIVPMRNGNLVLTAAETEVFKADLQGEKSFRADYGSMLTQLVALHTRMQQEMEDYKNKRSSSYFWKSHADSLTYLVLSAQRILEKAAQVCILAEQRGLSDKVKFIQAAQDKLRSQIATVAVTLQT